MPAARQLFKDGVDDSGNVLKGGREGVVSLLAHAVERLGDGFGLLARFLQHLLLFPLPRLPPHTPTLTPVIFRMNLFRSWQHDACSCCFQLGENQVVNSGTLNWDLDVLDAVSLLAAVGGEVSAASPTDADARELTKETK